METGRWGSGGWQEWPAESLAAGGRRRDWRQTGGGGGDQGKKEYGWQTYLSSPRYVQAANRNNNTYLDGKGEGGGRDRTF
jgi:hypothetical protein